MNLFRMKCEYCREKINKSSEIKRNVKVPGFIGTHPKHFCSDEHANNYEKEIVKHCKKSKGGSCCG